MGNLDRRRRRVSAEPTLYSIAPAPGGEGLAVTQVWQQAGDGPLPQSSLGARKLEAGGVAYLICPGAAGGATAVRITDSAPFVESAPSNLDIGGPWDAVEPFVLGNEPYVLAYAKATGNVSIFPVSRDLGTSAPYAFYRTRPPAISIGFDMITPVVVLSGVYIVGYIKKTGDVRVYSISVTASTPPSAPGTPPLLALPVWDHQWAPNWTHFAWFHMGGEVFFFKINDGKLNVNIDHLQDDPSEGTVAVGSHLESQLPDPLSLDIVRPLYVGGGDPHLLTYKSDGTTVVYRVRGDCQGWVEQASVSTVAGASDIVTYQLGDQTFALFH